MPLLRASCTCLFILLLCACAGQPAHRPVDSSQAPEEPRSLLLVSLDGFHPRYLEMGITPALSRIAGEGVRARWMTPAYPSLTFPNHYTLVTGLVPDHQGMVHNTMADPLLGDFRLSNRMAVGDSRWWGGEPIWVGAEKAGLRSATLFWPGSEAEIDGVRPTRWHPYDGTRKVDERVDEVLGWLAEPAHTRPRVATLYFEHVDEAAHGHGPDSSQALAAVREVDAAMGRLLAGLEQAGMLDRTNLLVVSDHGMAEVAPGNVVAVEDIVDPARARIVTVGQVVTIAPLPGHEAAVENDLVGRHERHECWRKGELPARWRYGSHPRIPAIVCQMDEGWDAVRREHIARRPTDHPRGSHGYDPDLPSMRALFIGRGPDLAEGVVLEPFDNVDVYPLLARLVGIEPTANDGNPETLLPALRTRQP